MAPDRAPLHKPRLVIIVGPTASGKTDLAVKLAERLDGEIINADSMQVYRGMNIGTAKPSETQRQRVPHHLLDIVTPDRNFSASDFRTAADSAIADIAERGKKVVVAGGTGLYIRALIQGLVDSPSGDEALRRQLNELSQRDGKEALLQRLAEVDPVTAARLHPNDQVRIVRALEVFYQTGHPISRFRSEHDFAGNYYRYLMVGIHVERRELYQRIEARVDEMMARGLEREVRDLLAAGFSPSLKAMKSIGYRQICSFLNNEYDLEEAIRLIKRDTRRYAKRQLTWFNMEREIKWVEYPGNFDNIWHTVIEFLSKGEDYAESAI